MINPSFFTPKLDVKSVLKAYPLGFFPWSSAPCAWYSPSPRMVFLKEVYDPKSLKRFKKLYTLKADEDFLPLMKLCARRENSWIDEVFLAVYNELFLKGVAHCLSVYENEVLVGGIYGLIFGKVFFGESMVSTAKNASKVALVRLCKELFAYGFLVDAQVYNPHLAFMGAKAINKDEFLQILEKNVALQAGFTDFKSLFKD